MSVTERQRTLVIGAQCRITAAIQRCTNEK